MPNTRFNLSFNTVRFPKDDEREIYFGSETNQLCPTLVEIFHDDSIAIRNSVRKCAEYFRREFNYDFVQYDVDSHSIGRIILAYRKPFVFDDLSLRYIIIGAMAFDQHRHENGAPYWLMTWAWLHPYCRSKGILSGSLPKLEQLLGKFEIDPPYSPSMVCFIKKYRPDIKINAA